QSTPWSDALKQPIAQWRRPDHLPQATRLASTVGEYLSDELSAAAKNLRNQCAQCHRMKDDAGSLDIDPMTMHPIWLAHAQFSHVAHRKVDCTQCHAVASPKDGSEQAPTVAMDTGDPYIPGLQVCLKCHSPPRETQTAATGGVRFDCILCHRYHDVDDPWHGRGNSARGADRVTIPEFIRGRPETGKASSGK